MHSRQLVVRLTSCSNELITEFSSEQWLWKLSEKPTNSCSYCIHTESIKAHILRVYNGKEFMLSWRGFEANKGIHTFL